MHLLRLVNTGEEREHERLLQLAFPTSRTNSPGIFDLMWLGLRQGLLLHQVQVRPAGIH